MSDFGVETNGKAASLGESPRDCDAAGVCESGQSDEELSIPCDGQATGLGKSSMLKKFGMAGFLFFLIKGVFWLVAGITAVGAGGSLF